MAEIKHNPTTGEVGFKFDSNDVWPIFQKIKKKYLQLHTPKNKIDKIGIIVAIKTENSREEVRLKNDFLEEIKKYLTTSNYGHFFHIIQFTYTLSGRVNNIADAKKYLYKSKAHFIIYGKLFERQIKGENNFVFKLSGAVRHKPIPARISNEFALEFSSFLPGKITIPESDELNGFEITNQFIGITIKYIIATAAFYSGDLQLSYILYDELQAQLNHYDDENPIIFALKKKLHSKLINVLRLKIEFRYYLFTLKRERKLILDTKKYLDELAKLDPDNPYAHTARAIYHFITGNLSAAISEMQSSKIKDELYPYNLGFLLACNGEIDHALEQYQKIPYLDTKSKYILDIEFFMSETLENDPTKEQLYFFRGLINYRKKLDNKLAKNDFESFLASKTAEKYSQLRTLAEKYLSNIGSNLGDI